LVVSVWDSSSLVSAEEWVPGTTPLGVPVEVLVAAEDHQKDCDEEDAHTKTYHY
jgi:hypothetical protein